MPRNPTCSDRFWIEADYWLGFFFILDVVSTTTLVLDLTWAGASFEMASPLDRRVLVLPGERSSFRRDHKHRYVGRGHLGLHELCYGNFSVVTLEGVAQVESGALAF